MRERLPEVSENRGVVRMKVRVNSKDRLLNLMSPNAQMMKRACVFDTKETGLMTGVERDETVSGSSIYMELDSDGYGIEAIR